MQLKTDLITPFLDHEWWDSPTLVTTFKNPNYANTNIKHIGERRISTQICQNINYKVATLSTMLWLLVENIYKKSWLRKLSGMNFRATLKNKYTFEEVVSQISQFSPTLQIVKQLLTNIFSSSSEPPNIRINVFLWKVIS